MNVPGGGDGTCASSGSAEGGSEAGGVAGGDGAAAVAVVAILGTRTRLAIGLDYVEVIVGVCKTSTEGSSTATGGASGAVDCAEAGASWTADHARNALAAHARRDNRSCMATIVHSAIKDNITSVKHSGEGAQQDCSRPPLSANATCC